VHAFKSSEEMRPTDELIPYIIYLCVLLASVGYFAYVCYQRLAVLRLAAPESRFDHLGERFKGLVIFFLGQGRFARKRYWFAGFMHAFIFWGFLVLLLRNLQVLGQGLVAGFELPWLGPEGSLSKPYAVVRDLFEVLVLVMVLAAGFRRAVVKPKRLTLSWDATLILTLIGTLMITDLLIAGSEASAGTPGGLQSPAGRMMAGVLPLGVAVAHTVHAVAWWIHIGALLFFLSYLPRSKHFHIVTSVLSVFFRTLDGSALRPIEIEKATHFGVSKIEQFHWKDILDVYACTECGRCQDACPAFATHKPLNPKWINENMRDHLYEKTPLLLRHFSASKAGEEIPYDGTPLVGGVIPEEAIWACTTCRACEEACPLFIDFIGRIVDMRRHLVLEEARFPENLLAPFTRLETTRNPWGMDRSLREEWAKGLGVPKLADVKNDGIEVLFWVGCAGAFEERGRKISRGLVEVLRAAGVKFAILGGDEGCTGDPARRAGNEYLFQTLAQANIETLNRYRIRNIVTHCPHCFNTLKNEYPQLGGNYQVIHHTEFVAQLIRDRRIKPTKGLRQTITYHDACYLGRHNRIYDAPREILQSIPGVELVEMKRSKQSGFCCGAGGARLWIDEPVHQRVSHERVREAAAMKPSTIGTACPFCTIMLGDGVKDTGHEDEMQVIDVVQLLSQTLEA